MNINDLTIGQAKELAALFGKSAASKQVIDHGLSIVVLDRGFVYIGFAKTDGEWVYIDKAKNIRYWGTSKGLGELVSGPTSSTKLDSVGNIKVPFHALQQVIGVEVEKWNKEF